MQTVLKFAACSAALVLTLSTAIVNASPMTTIVGPPEVGALTVPQGTDDEFDLRWRATPLSEIIFGLDHEPIEVQVVDPGVPEPATLSLLGLGLAGAAFVLRRRRRR